MPRPATVVLGWVAATAAAVGVAYLGVSSVAGGVVEPLPATVGRPSPSVLAEGRATHAASEQATTPSPTPTDEASSTSPTPGTSASAAPDVPVTTPTAAPSPAPAPTVSPSSRPAPASQLRTYSMVGGSATLRYEPGRVTVVSAEPAQGFSYGIEGNGTAEVRVDFVGEEHRSRLQATWEDDGPHEEIEESGESHDDDDGEEHD